MLLYLNTKIAKKFSEEIIFLSILNYIFSIGILKFFEFKQSMVGFFNIYIILVIILDIGFCIYFYIKNYIMNIKHINTDLNEQTDDIINSKFKINQFNDDLLEYNNLIQNISKKNNKKVKIIKKDNLSETDLKNFNDTVVLVKDNIVTNTIISEKDNSNTVTLVMSDKIN